MARKSSRSSSRLDAVTTERDQLLTAQADQVQQNQQWQEAVDSRDRRIRELEEEHDGICQMLQSVEQGAFEQVDLANKLQNQLETLRAERDQLASSIPEQQAHSQQLEQALAERDGQITLLSEELTKSKERQSELETQIAGNNDSTQALQAEVAELQSRCEQLTTANTAREQDRAAAEQKLSASEEQIQELQQQLTSTEQQRQALEQELASGSQSSETIRAEHADLQTRFEQLSANYQEETQHDASNLPKNWLRASRTSISLRLTLIACMPNSTVRTNSLRSCRRNAKRSTCSSPACAKSWHPKSKSAPQPMVNCSKSVMNLPASWRH